MHLAFLASQETLPGSQNRRIDAFEHDQMMAALTPAFEAAGDKVSDIAWDDPAADWSAFDAVMVGTCWDYQDRLDEFLAVLKHIETQTRLFNSRALIDWNGHKRYLRDLEARGARLIPTLWVDRADDATIRDAFVHFGADELVVKRQVGAGASGQHRLKRGDKVPAMPWPMKIQPFMPAIEREGELSFIFIGGSLSHTLLKTAAPGDYRIQSAYGGREQAITPSEADITAASQALRAVEGDPLYARVDMLRADDGGLMLMELELIEPFLYPLQGPKLGALLHDALAARLKAKP